MDATDVKAARRRWVLGLLLIALLFFVPLPRGLRGDRTLSRVSDLAHLPLLAVVTVLFHARGPARGRLAAAGLGAALVAALIETGQAFTGRQASLVDLAIGGVGIVGGMAWSAWRARRPERAPLALAGVCLALVAVVAHLWPVPGWFAAEAWARRSFPTLSGLETEVELPNWEGSHGAVLTAVAADPAPGLAMRVEARGRHPYPGAELTGFPRDWRGRTRLLWLARAPGAERPLTYGVRLDDAPGRLTDYAGGSYRAGPEWRQYEMALDSLAAVSGRPLELKSMLAIAFYLPRAPAGTLLELDDVRLR